MSSRSLDVLIVGSPPVFSIGKPDENSQIYDSNTYEKDYVYLGIAGQPDAAGVFDLEQRNKFSVGETIEIMKPDGRNIEVTVEHIRGSGRQ